MGRAGPPHFAGFTRFMLKTYKSLRRIAFGEALETWNSISDAKFIAVELPSLAWFLAIKPNIIAKGY